LIVAAAPFVLTVTLRDPVRDPPPSTMSPAPTRRGPPPPRDPVRDALPSTLPPGVLGILTGPDDTKITGVLPGSPAEVAGLRAGDRILKIDGIAIENPRQLRDIVSGGDVGRSVVVLVGRRGEPAVLQVVLQRRDSHGDRR
jgi:S1-C subfamily serine protease